MYKYDATRIKYPYTREELVTSIIRENYTQDNMEAIINNHISGSETEEQAEVFSTMQAWRVKAKDVAKLIFEK